jgi:rare lipoprotein A (peptidoglycan hydrolase)
MHIRPVRAGEGLPWLFSFVGGRRVATIAMLAVATASLVCVEAARADWSPSWSAKVVYASWYGYEFAWQPTASGEPFDPDGLTGAHRTLPLGTRLRVTNLSNGRSVLVTITDRGPFVGRRELDLSYGAARKLGMVRAGVARVMMEPVLS